MALGVGALAITVVVLGRVFGTNAAGGADSSGYLSQADLWAQGRLEQPLPAASHLAWWPGGYRAFAPLGWSATSPEVMVPTYPPGLPLVMAAAMKATGRRSSALWVVPVFGGAVIWLTFLIGWCVDGPATGLAAACLLASSPIFLLQLMAPMSDVPVTAWWLLALHLSTKRSNTALLLAGAAASAAVLTRPNLLPLALIPVIAASATREGGWRTGLRGAALVGGLVVPGGLLLAWLNRRLRGSPTAFGYGSLDALYSWGALWPNLSQYVRWLVQEHSPILLIGLLAPVLLHERWRAGGRDRRSWIALSSWTVFVVAVLLCYVPYLEFGAHEWTYLRFLLPGLAALTVLCLAAVFRCSQGLAPRWRAFTRVCIILCLALWSLNRTMSHRVFDVARAERRYPAVGQFASGALPANAVFVALQQTGSLNYYSGRPVLRWPRIPRDGFSRVLLRLEHHGYAPYIVLEEWEEPLFTKQFARHGGPGRLDWPPTAEYQGPMVVRIYSPADRPRFAAGIPIRTVNIR